MYGCSLRLGLYLKVDCMNQSETNFSRTAQSQRFWQGAICHVWTSKLDKHWRHSQKERLTYKLVDRLKRLKISLFISKLTTWALHFFVFLDHFP